MRWRVKVLLITGTKIVNSVPICSKSKEIVFMAAADSSSLCFPRTLSNVWMILEDMSFKLTTRDNLPIVTIAVLFTWWELPDSKSLTILGMIKWMNSSTFPPKMTKALKTLRETAGDVFSDVMLSNINGRTLGR
ncbi:hypothetical protein WICPIJ_006012 [Wickerhamomyces pijperi]|uniref:Uncharacterized protein n=1 Tax=Wickerhamomyces pijperi TaxID=599730 RepID=A0A9P8Q2F6_WICPI|nr:hypothetical protein WICPIJ_006012 [Wickerhamomyces pijperi]